MKNILIAILVLLLFGFCCGIIGFFIHKKFSKPVIIEREKIVTNTVYRDYQKIVREKCIENLICYDQSEFKLDINPKVIPGEYRITASLCEREAYRDVKIDCGSSGNWKLYLGIGIGAAATGFACYKIYEVVK